MRRSICSLSEALYFTSYGIFLTFSILYHTFYAEAINSGPHQLVVVVCLGLLVLKELTTERFCVREMICLIGCALLCLIAVRVGVGLQQKSVAFLFLYVFCARDLSFSRIGWVTIGVTGTVCVFVMLSSFTGLIDNVVLVQEKEEITRVRECMGFRYSLYLPTCFMNITALWACIRKERITIWGVAALLLIDWWLYQQTDSRTTFVFSAIMLVAALVMKWLPRLVERLRPLFFLTIFSYPVAAVVSLWLTASYDPSVPWMKQLNVWLGSRLSLGKNSIVEHGFSLLGESITWIGGGLKIDGSANTEAYSYVDCFYLQILQHFGILFSVVCLAAVVLMMYRCYRRREYYLLVAMTLVAVHCMLDDLSQYLCYNTFWLVAGPVLIGMEQTDAAQQERPRHIPGFRLQW